MTELSVRHATFTVERVYPSAPSRVFRAWVDPAAKARWASCHAGQETTEFDFRVGGREIVRLASSDGPVYLVEFRYHDIQPDRRIVYAYAMQRDDVRSSVSLVTIEFLSEGTGTRLVFTEQGAFLDGHDSSPQRAHGTGEALDRLGELLRQEAA